MFSKLAIISCLIALAYAVPKRAPRIAGGQDVEAGQHPYYASLYHRDSLTNYPISFGGATILNNQWLLTAAYNAYAVENVDEIVIKAGNIYYRKASETEQIRNVVARFVYPDYKDNLGPYDIALLKLDAPLEFNDFVAPIHLPQAGSIPSGSGAVTGLGSLKHMMTAHFPETLQSVSLPIIDNKECEKITNDILGDYASEIILVDEWRFCTGPTETNQGYCLHDTGDPLTVKENGKDVIVGVATFGFAADCETPGTPSIYSRVSAFVEWIQYTISEN